MDILDQIKEAVDVLERLSNKISQVENELSQLRLLHDEWLDKFIKLQKENKDDS